MKEREIGEKRKTWARRMSEEGRRKQEDKREPGRVTGSQGLRMREREKREEWRGEVERGEREGEGERGGREREKDRTQMKKEKRE